jgi:hypothetical protein
VANATVGQLDNWYTYEKNNKRYLVRPVSAISTNAFGEVAQIKSVMNMAHNYRRCMEDNSYCVENYWFNAFGFNESQADNSAVQIEQHCMSQSDCIRTFYYSSAYEGVDPHGEVYGTYALLNPNTLIPRGKFYKLKDYHATVAPAMPGKMVWSFSGAVPGYFCTGWNETRDAHTWSDNYLCSLDDIGLQFSNSGPVAGKSCISVNEGADPDSWADNYLCTTANNGLAWRTAGPMPGRVCIQISEPSDPHTWNDNYLCWLP